MKDKLEKMNVLCRRLSIFFHDLYAIENGLAIFENDACENKMKEIIPEESAVLEMLVKESLHFQYIQIKMRNVLGFIERLKSQMKTIKTEVNFIVNEVTEERASPKGEFSLTFRKTAYSAFLTSIIDTSSERSNLCKIGR